MRSVDADLGVASVVVHKNKILLVQEAKGPYSGKWGLPKGFVDQDELPADAILRELSEECGLEGRVSGVMGIRETVHSGRVCIFIVYRVDVDEHVLRICTDEISDAGFFGIEEMKGLDWISDVMEFLASAGLNDSSSLFSLDMAPIRMRPYMVHLGSEVSA